MNWDAWAAFINQMRAVTPHVPFGGSFQGESLAISVACWGKSVPGACGQSINTANAGGNTIANIFEVNDGYYTHQPIEFYLRARQSANSIITDYFNAVLEEGLRFRGLVDILDPAVPLTLIGQGTPRSICSTEACNQYTVVSCTAHTVTTSTPHNVTNVVPGISRLWISGSSDPKCNSNFYISPHRLHHAFGGLAATRTTCVAAGSGSCGYNNAGNATLTFANGDKIGVGSSNKGDAVSPLYEIPPAGWQRLWETVRLFSTTVTRRFHSTVAERWGIPRLLPPR